jgi:RHS repeat-associated protein
VYTNPTNTPLTLTIAISTDKPTYFDELDLQITQQQQNVIAQENNYYAFGLNLHGTEYTNGQEHRWQYNGKELQEEFDLWYNDHGARNLALGIDRWIAIDPLAEKYYSLSPYVSMVNNPLMIIDPDGKDILFYQWENDGDGNWERKLINFSQLDPRVQKALEAFAKTELGYNFLKDFAKKGQRIGSVKFLENGKYSKYDLAYDMYLEENSDELASTNVLPNTENPSFYVKINTKTARTVTEFAVTIGHEAFIHTQQYEQKATDAMAKKDLKTLYAIYNANRASDGGKADHLGYINGLKAYGNMKTYISQLKKVLNPQDVQKAIQKHDEQHRRLKNKNSKNNTN